MNLLIRTFAVIAACTVFADGAFAQSSVVIIDKEPAPKLIVEPPLPGQLAQGLVFIPYRVENLRILPLGGAVARNVSPRVGHLHVTVDDLPWFWADYGQSNTIILVGLPRGQHKVLIELVDPEGNVFTGRTVMFNAPGKAPLAVGSALAPDVAQAQQPGTKRTDLQRNDLSAPGREVIQVRVDFEPGVAFGMHSHPGAEAAYVLEGTLEYQLEGAPPVTLKAGEALFIPAGTVHTAKNVGTGNAAELATYIVEKGKPLVVLAR